ncbi:leukocyte receptor cluster member 8 [Dorcoceras hygrometricum]|uniref:Leukocyte receptor cluster member 8 n=1 Tax=Dorcoceras hygrometricum TaxID=472368 RepID=A0A2Z7AXC1_9LAMI|nr:leukocyte receptor cluster member 8 [Dorcoceras hygrometricum]
MYQKHQIVDPHQAHTPYHSPKRAAMSWNMPGENHSSKENGLVTDANYIHNQQVEMTLRNDQNGINAASGASTSNSGATITTQGYSGYAVYPNTDSYGYTSTAYAGYYNGYQQQPNQYQQQPNQYQQQSSQYQQQYSQYQQQSNQYQQQSNQSYAHVGAYQNTGAQYEPLSSFQNTGSYAGPASYSSTYYNPGDYQTSGSYTSGTYASQTNLWQGQPYAAYNSEPYPNYTPDSNSSYSSTPSVATNHYQQHYKQWEDYYRQSQTEVSCAPGTEKLSSFSASSLSSSVPNANSGYIPSNNQMPVAYTPSWRPESGSSELTSLQPVTSSGSNAESYRIHGDSVIQNDPRNSLQMQVPNISGTVPTYESFQNKQNSTFSQDATTLYTSYQVHASSQPASQPLESLDARRVNKMQIPNNPRIASNLPLSVPKADKDNSMIGATAKPAYIGVSVQKPNEKVLTHDASDSMLKPGMFPKSLRGYVERALARCRDDRQIAACQVLMKEIITEATADGTLYTKDWDTEPILPLPSVDTVNKETAQLSILTSMMPGTKKSPTRRAKSRWEPIMDVSLAETSANRSERTPKYGGWNKQFTDRKIENKEDNLGNQLSSADPKVFSKNLTRPSKRQRLGDDLNALNDMDDSSDSDVEQSLTKYSATAVTLADSSEEKKRRENRSKRFEKKHGNRAQDIKLKANNVGSGSLYARRASALILSRNVEESGSRAVEDIDWDALTVKGSCQEIEKRYLRLTSAPDPATVRPEEVLEKALLMVQNSQKNYLYKCDQLKSIRQDLTVQHIRNELTVKVYEMHARLAMEVGDLPEFNQCQSQLKALYAEGIRGCNMEFAAYNLLCVILHSNNNREILSAMSRLSVDARKDEAVKHALSVHAAVTSGNYVTFFRLYKTAPNNSTFFMDLHVEKMRYSAVKCMCRSYRPTVPISYIAQILGFVNALPTTEASDHKEVDGGEECVDWLKAHGACLTSDNYGEVLLDTKASVPSLYMPEPEDAVAHGDASLAVNDFLTRSLA